MPPALTDIKGVGTLTAKRLSDNGLDTVEAVARAASDKIVAVPGFGALRAAAVKSAATELLAQSAGTAANSTPEARQPEAKQRRTLEQIEAAMEALMVKVDKLSSQKSASGWIVQASGGEPVKLSLNVHAEVDFHSGEAGWTEASTSGGPGTGEGRTQGPGTGEGRTQGPGTGEGRTRD